MTSPKSLRIMQFHHKKEQPTMTNDSLMSPPLTPTEATHESFYHYPITKRRQRKEFIQSYSKMVPYLRPNGGDSIFALNVYRDMYLKPSITKKEDEPMPAVAAAAADVVPAQHQLPSIQQQQQQKSSLAVPVVMKRKRVSSLLPSGKEAALAFDSIDIDTIDQEFYPMGWVPHSNALDLVPVKVCWKGKDIQINKDSTFF